MKKTTHGLLLAGTACWMLVACGSEKKEEAMEHSAAPAASTSTGGEVKPDPGGKTVEVEIYSDEKGSYFKPSEITVKKGDVVKYELKSGVHNVHFLPDSNPGAKGLPNASDMLQLPDQEYFVKIDWAAGKYYFQCDPHALTGMKGHVTVK